MKEISGIWFPDGDQHFAAQMAIGPRIDGKGTYQFKKYQAAMEYLPKDRRRFALDIGGHVGLWARVMAMDFKQVLSFEPLAAHIECWERNLEGVKNATLVQCAIGSKHTTIKVHMPPDNTGHAHVLDDKGEDVLCLRLDDMAYHFDYFVIPPTTWSDLDFIKIDVEGFETFVIEGAEQTIKKYRPLIVVEQKPGNAERYSRGQHGAVRLLESWGMHEIWVISGDHLMGWPETVKNA